MRCIFSDLIKMTRTRLELIVMELELIKSLVVVSKGFWSSKENQIEYLKWLGVILNVNTADEWYGVSNTEFVSNNGKELLSMYQGSPSELVMSVLPEHDWKLWMFKTTPHGLWSSKENQRKYMKWLFSVLKMKKMDDWYGVTVESFTSNYGSELLSLYEGYPSGLIMASFPEHDWNPWMFEVVSKGFWSSKENQIEYLKWLGVILNVNTADEWYRVSRDAFEQNNGKNLMELYKGSVEHLISSSFPDKSPRHSL